MRVALSWLRDYASLPADLPLADLDAALVAAGLEVEEVFDLRDAVAGPLVIGTVLSITELTDFKKPIRYCTVDVGETQPRGIVCGARNFAEGDSVVAALPGAELPGGFSIAARKTYGHISDGMLASARELGLGDDHTGILVLSENGATVPGADARPVIGLDEVIFELAITPDMSHCFSMRGVAREVAHQLQVPFTDPVELVEEPRLTDDQPYPIQVSPESGCDRFATRAVRGIDPRAESPQWMKQRLAHAGMRAISLPVDITNYVMLEFGQPMHAWDISTLTGSLQVRRAHDGEQLTTLDDVKRQLDPEDVVICDDTGPLSLAGVMGGDTSEISATTTDVLMEAAHWDPVAIARAARRHRLSSEAAKRFERGSDPAICRFAAQRAVELLAEYGGGVTDTRVGDIDTCREPVEIYMDLSLPARIVGVDYTDAQVTKMLSAAGCTWTVDADRVVAVTPPSWRPDVTDQADLVEEVVRLDGYHKVDSVLPTAPAGHGLTASQRRGRQISRGLAAAGYVETLNYPFCDPAIMDVLGVEVHDSRREMLKIVNPIVETEPALRTTLLPGLLKALRTNVDRGNRDVALFESGLVFIPQPGWDGRSIPELPVDHRPSDAQLAETDAVRPQQPQHLGTVICGQTQPPSWLGPGRAADWTDAIAAAHRVAAAAGTSFTVNSAEHAPWHPGRCAELVCEGKVVGHAGEVHPAVCDALGVPRRTAAMELNVADLPLNRIAPAPVISHYPIALIDVAVVVDSEVPVAAIADALSEGAGELLEGIQLFDVYTGAQLGEGRKSVAYKLSFRADDRTLTAEETVAARTRAVEMAQQRVGAQLRDV